MFFGARALITGGVCGCSSVGRALAFQARCREFEPRRPLHRIDVLKRPCGSVVEHSLGKGEVAGPIPAMGTISGADALE